MARLSSRLMRPRTQCLLRCIAALMGRAAVGWPATALSASRILFVARGESANNTYELYTMAAHGTNGQRITTNTV